MLIGAFQKKYGFLRLAFLTVCFFAFGSQAFAVTVEDTFYFKSGTDFAVEYQGSPTGEPRFNSGVNYFDMAGPAQVVDSAYQARVFVEDGSPVSSPFPVEGFAWNDTWGWISFMCDGGFNRGQACAGDYQTAINITSFPVGYFTGQAWNPQIGEIDFDWTCPPADYQCSVGDPGKRMKVNFLNGDAYGYAWNDSVGWIYFNSDIDPIPELSGFMCGNALIELPEQCDDGDSDNNNICRNDCTLNACGDGYIASGEECDDNNVVNGDGCDSSCQDEISPSCGDGVPQFGEACDDGNLNNNDECKNNCTYGVCGDGILWGVSNGGVEACDDGNLNNTDACRNDCTLTPPAAICGDGVRQAAGADAIPGNADDEECDLGGNNKWNGACLPNCKNFACGDTFVYPAREQCDDGNTISGDGCTGTSGPIPTWCRKEPSAPPAQCGDNVTTAPETCDDGNVLNRDGCSATCSVESSVCGDGFRNPYTEGCDDGNPYSGDGCSSLCQDEVPGAVCGNGSIEPNSIYGGDEECDDDNVSSYDGCSSKCKVEAAWCGDGVANGTEQCDDGNSVNTDTCRNNCTFGSYGICGNGTLDFGETCDDGNNQNGDNCSSTCQEEVVSDPLNPDSPVVSEMPVDDFVSISDCEDVVAYFSKLFNIELDYDLICNESCGNGYLEGDETCDDGNDMGNDGCSAFCEDETAGAVCGNGIEEFGERCDDGGNESGDGCSAYCEDEDQVILLDDPTCEEAFEIFEDVVGIDVYALGYCNTEPYCGNGTWDIGEECDATDPSDPYSIYCNDWCEFYPIGWCGDGIQDPGEECDDANFQDGDGCDEWCEYEYEAPACGDLLWSLGEECDASDPLYLAEAPAGTYCGDATSTAPCELLTEDTCGTVPGRQAGEECDGSAPTGYVCTSSCELEILPTQLTCFPYTDVVKTFDASDGDVYEVSVRLNCLEEPSVENPWNVTVTAFDEYNTVDCDQTNADSELDRCVVKTSISTPLTTPQAANDFVPVAEIYSRAPTGYTSEQDEENLYTLHGVQVKVTDSDGSQLFLTEVPVGQAMDFSPLVGSGTLNASFGINNYVQYLDLGYEDTVEFMSILNKYITPQVTQVRAVFNLSLDSNSPYEFVFDVNKDGDWSDPGDISLLNSLPNGGNINASTWTALNANQPPPPFSPTYNYPAKIIGISDNGPAQGEKLTMEIRYTYGTKAVRYMADQLPDTADFRVDGYDVQITGPVNTDKILGGSAGFAQVGNVGEAVGRKDIVNNVARIVKKDDIAPSAPTFFSFVTNSILPTLTGGDYLDYQISTGGESFTDQYVYYFKDDVVLSRNGGLSNTKNRAVIVEGGDVYIDNNITNLPLSNVAENELSRLEIIVLKDREGNGGNVFIGPDVTYLAANIVADGSMFPYDGNSKGGQVPNFEDLEENGDLDNQLTFEGSLTSNNTIGGADATCATNDPCYKGDGSRTTVPNVAKIYDLDYFRRHGLVPADSDSAGNPQECNGVPGLQISGGNILTTHTCNATSTPKSDMIPIGIHTRATNENYGMYFNYVPPANNSVIFRGAVGANVSGN